MYKVLIINYSCPSVYLYTKEYMCLRLEKMAQKNLRNWFHGFESDISSLVNIKKDQNKVRRSSYLWGREQT